MICVRCAGLGKVRDNAYGQIDCRVCMGTGRRTGVTPLPHSVPAQADPFQEVPTNPTQKTICAACRGGLVTRIEREDGTYSTKKCPACDGDGLVSYEAASEWLFAQQHKRQ